MSKTLLNKKQVYELVSENRYRVLTSNRFISRCIDGRYKNSDDLPPLAMAGADAGELAVIYAAANQYGFKIDEKKVLAVLTQIVGGEKNLQVHTDTHAHDPETAAGCGHMKQIRTDSKAYGLEQDQVVALNKRLKEVHKKGANEVTLEGDHQEGAVLQIEGMWSVQPQYVLPQSENNVKVQVFVFHKTLADMRHKQMATQLVETGAVTLYDDLDADYLYEVLSEVTETQLMETAKRLAPGLPIYLVKFEEDGRFDVSDLGAVPSTTS